MVKVLDVASQMIKESIIHAFHRSAWLDCYDPDKLTSPVQVWRIRIPDSWSGNNYPVRRRTAIERILPEMPGHA